jgi:exosortase A-associated hydrolase 1
VTETIVERALTFDCMGETLVAIVSEPKAAPKVGVLVVVGGPQYRAGSHRQFVLLGRRLSEAGIAVMRFDYRGMGDSTGNPVSFEQTGPDIAGALTSFLEACPSLQRVALWGLCDAASACLLYWHRSPDPRVSGMVLLNPWVRSEATLAKVHLTQYYPQRLASRDFWVRLIAGKVDVIRALRALAKRFSALNRAHIDGTSRVQFGFQSKMLDALKDFGGPILLITSDRDLTAMEFLEHCRSTGTFEELVARGNVEHHALAAADHTFSSAAWRGDVEQATLNWLQRRFSLQPR